MDTKDHALQRVLSSRWSWLCPRPWLVSADTQYPATTFVRCVFCPETPRTPPEVVFYFRRSKTYIMPLAVPLDVIAALCIGMKGAPVRRLRRLAHLLYVMHCEYWASLWGAEHV